MKRRKFIEQAIKAGLYTSTAFSFWSCNNTPSNTNNNSSVVNDSLSNAVNKKRPDLPHDLVAAKNSSPQNMFDKAIESLGGIKQFVKANQTVVVKPNIGWDASPERAANTNPNLVKRVIEHCIQAGAKKVYVFDYTCNDWKNCYKNSGIEYAVKQAGGIMVPGNDEKYYQEITIEKGKNLKTEKEHELVLESDVFINIPILKHHGGAKLTMAMKNLMGIAWERRSWHKNDLHQCIADFASYRKPDLNIIDAYNVLLKNGPKGVSVDDVAQMKSLIISPDMVSADAAAAKIFGSKPEEIPYIKIANEMGSGIMDLTKLNINKINMG